MADWVGGEDAAGVGGEGVGKMWKRLRVGGRGESERKDSVCGHWGRKGEKGWKHECGKGEEWVGMRCWMGKSGKQSE